MVLSFHECLLALLRLLLSRERTRRKISVPRFRFVMLSIVVNDFLESRKQRNEMGENVGLFTNRLQAPQWLLLSKEESGGRFQLLATCKRFVGGC